MTLVLGVVPYLNALPLYHTLRAESASGVDATRPQIIRAVPSQLAPMLSRGDCDAALIPIIEHFRGAGERIVSDACIGSSGPVRSVLLFCNVAPRDIGRVAVDASSRTSVALLRLVLRDGYGIAPEFIEHVPDRRAMLQAADAALLIGDNALEAATESHSEIRDNKISILDLGEEWMKLTRRPFVYAAWVARRGLGEERARELAALLNTARDEGLNRLPEIARENAGSAPLSGVKIEEYLRQAIDYSLTSQHRAGLEGFRRRCVACGLL